MFSSCSGKTSAVSVCEQKQDTQSCQKTKTEFSVKQILLLAVKWKQLEHYSVRWWSHTKPTVIKTRNNPHTALSDLFGSLCTITYKVHEQNTLREWDMCHLPTEWVFFLFDVEKMNSNSLTVGQRGGSKQWRQTGDKYLRQYQKKTPHG